MADSTPDMSELIGRLMADEKFGELLQSVRSSISADVDNADPPAEETAAENTSDETPPVPAIPALSPELISKLPEIMGMLSPDGGGKKGGSKMEDRKRLLNAMKPFLSEKRRTAVDSIVNIAGIADLFGI